MSNRSKSYLVLTPILGLILYIILYILGSYEYAGGSVNYPDSQGYSFSNNLLCDLMLPVGVNGLVNEGRQLGIISHVTLSISMMIFFYILPKIFSEENRNTQLTRYLGITGMIIFSFMFTIHHDIVVSLTAIMGTLALIPLFLEMRTYHGKTLTTYAYFCFFMSVIVFLSFITKVGYYYLPILQKIVFVIDAIWVIWISLIVSQKYNVSSLSAS